MATDGSGGSGVNALAIVAILVLVIGAGFFAMKSGVIGGNGSKIEVKVQPQAPAAAKE